MKTIQYTMKRVLLTLLISCTGILYGQKYTYNYAQLMTPEGKVIERWKTDSHILFSWDLLTIGSEDDKVLSTIIPGSIFDTSPFRNFVRQSDTDTTLSTDSVQHHIYITKYMSMIYYNKVTIMTGDEKDFVVFIPNTSVGIVLFNNPIDTNETK